MSGASQTSACHWERPRVASLHQTAPAVSGRSRGPETPVQARRRADLSILNALSGMILFGLRAQIDEAGTDQVIDSLARPLLSRSVRRELLAEDSSDDAERLRTRSSSPPRTGTHSLGCSGGLDWLRPQTPGAVPAANARRIEEDGEVSVETSRTTTADAGDRPWARRSSRSESAIGPGGKVRRRRPSWSGGGRWSTTRSSSTTSLGPKDRTSILRTVLASDGGRPHLGGGRWAPLRDPSNGPGLR